MKKNTFKRFIAVVLCFCIFASSCIFASAADDTPLLSIDVASAKKDYQKGETADLNVTLRNNSLADLGAMCSYGTNTMRAIHFLFLPRVRMFTKT